MHRLLGSDSKCTWSLIGEAQCFRGWWILGG